MLSRIEGVNRRIHVNRWRGAHAYGIYVFKVKQPFVISERLRNVVVLGETGGAVHIDIRHRENPAPVRDRRVPG